ncbi:HAD family hydrolase [Photobacterium sp. TY1-4]|uniref:HAD family hydrolase n=1 Tax=Photobacterium sp. TY1-4 TaxID=2899122 RepID=UPI0021C24EE3|nr:HAD family phosphatase [Photobacterium sp. TY1-4]UXI03143.1 HAD family phosphatase [Photobacterium sp. TY1-4]
MKFAAVMFDMDGVVIDSSRVVEASWSSVAVEYGIYLSREEMKHQIHGRPGMDVLNQIFGHLPDAELMTIQKKLEQFEERAEYPLIPGVQPVLAKLKASGIPVALVTSSWEEKVNAVLQSHDLSAYFSVIVTRDDVVHGKPAPDCYQLAARLLDVDVARCLIFEDSEMGIQSAVDSGAACLSIGRVGSPQTNLEIAGFADFAQVGEQYTELFA